MTTLLKIVLSAALLLLFSCNDDPSLQKYFVKNTENKDFVALDLTPKMLIVDNSKLSITQKEALNAFEKVNILAFKVNEKNKANFETERAKVALILKDKKYQQLMKFGSGKEGAQISFVGQGEHIEEFIIYGNKKDNGFAVVRVLGKDMNPTHIMDMMTVLENTKIDKNQLSPILEMFK